MDSSQKTGLLSTISCRIAIRHGMYGLLIAVAVGVTVGRICGPKGLGARQPFPGGNDRSRWDTIRALVEQGTYSIDDIVDRPGWDTIDMVRHRGPDGSLHQYSSKPPLLATLVAGEYWLIFHLSGASLESHPFAVGELILITFNVVPLVVYFLFLARLLERFGQSDWGRLFVMAAATFGTFLTTFATVLNSHVPAAVTALATTPSSARCVKR